MDIQLVFTIIAAAAAVLFAGLYLKEVWNRSSDTSHRDIYDSLRHAHDCIDREATRMNQELVAIKEQQRSTCCYKDNSYKPAKTTR